MVGGNRAIGQRGGVFEGWDTGHPGQHGICLSNTGAKKGRLGLYSVDYTLYRIIQCVLSMEQKQEERSGVLKTDVQLPYWSSAAET